MDLRTQPPSRPTIVVVEDDNAVLNALAFALDAEGFHVRMFSSASTAWADPDVGSAACVVVDQILPDEPGLDLLARLRRVGVDTPAVLITTNPTLSLRTQAAALNIPIVEKPLLGDHLFAVIRGLIPPAA